MPVAGAYVDEHRRARIGECETFLCRLDRIVKEALDGGEYLRVLSRCALVCVGEDGDSG